MMVKEKKIAVVIPCYNVSAHIADVLERMPQIVSRIYCIDDCSSDETLSIILRQRDKRITHLQHNFNLGVGGAMVTGYRQALIDGYDIILKIDGDGQMAPEIISQFVEPIIDGSCDYTKGNRFTKIQDIAGMPIIRIVGNLLLSFLSKLSTGYWSVFDPNNGFTAIRGATLSQIPLEKLHKRYFFESDLLFRLYLTQAVVKDVPMKAVYGDEKSHLHISKVIIPFLINHLKNLCKRLVYKYFLLDFGLASLQLLLGFPLLFFGIVFGWVRWSISVETGIAQSSGTVMVSALSIILGVQFLLAFLNYDIQSVPKRNT